MTDYGAPPEPEPDPEPEHPSQWLAEVIRSVQTPAAAMQWFGIASVLLAALSVTIFLAAPDEAARWYLNQLAAFQKDQDPADRKPLPPVAELSRDMQIQYVGSGMIHLVCGFLIAFGGIRMKQLHGYGWAVTGAVLSAIPCTNSCCCVGLPIGLWALVILFGSDVRLAFARVGAVGGLGLYEEELRLRDEDPPSRPIRLE